MHINYPVTDSMAHNDRDNNICEICAVLVGWGTSVVLSVSMKMGDIVWFGTHITINSIGMKMGEPPDPTIYSWMSHWKYSMTMPTCECEY